MLILKLMVECVLLSNMSLRLKVNILLFSELMKLFVVVLKICKLDWWLLMLMVKLGCLMVMVSFFW